MKPTDSDDDDDDVDSCSGSGIFGQKIPQILRLGKRNQVIFGCLKFCSIPILVSVRLTSSIFIDSLIH